MIDGGFKIFGYLLFIYCVGFLSCGNAYSADNSKLSYLKKNFNNLYQSDYKQFWEILKEAEKRAVNCESAEATIDFLKLVEIESNNAEFNEYFNEKIEKLCIEQPKCFLDAMTNLNKKIIARTIEKLKTPLFVDVSDIDVVFKKNRGVKKYNVIMKEYFKK